MKKSISYLVIFCILTLSFMILKSPEICTESAISGLEICGNIIIPSLFPFTFCVLFILRSGILKIIKIPENIAIFLFSLIGGYPLGAKMLKESNLQENTKIQMLNFCVNAGPAFIILAVGNGIFKSQKIGFILFLAHILPTFIMSLFFKKCFRSSEAKNQKPTIDFIDNFTECSSLACSALISISGYVILFNIITAYTNHLAKHLPFLKDFNLILEITNGISQTHNIYLISALLGFGGICVWLQVFSQAKDIKINYPKFFFCRIFHALTSVLFTFIFIKLFQITIPTLSSGTMAASNVFQTNGSVGISLVLMGIVFIISLQNKNFAGNMLEDLV